ncbi:MAG: Hsp20 family protein [Rhodospirillales bacterium]|nr:Hsp20 family protein [Rhodospirillales bacterium]
MRSTFDLSPLFRATVGFDRVNALFDTLSRMDESAFAYPPYNIEKTGDNAYRITMAVAGFAENDLDVTVRESTLYVIGKSPEKEEGQYLHRGIARRAFERRFALADYVQVKGATLKDGLLSIELQRELPESAKPRKIEIAASSQPSRLIEGETAGKQAA